MTGFDLAGGTIAFTVTTVDRPAELYVAGGDGAERRLRRSPTRFVARARPRPAERFTAPVDRRRRGRRLGVPRRPTSTRPALPGAAQRPRRPVHPVRQPVLRRGPGAGGGRLRGRDVQPARLVGPRAGLGPGDHRSEAPEGARARAGAASTSTTCMAVARRGAAALPRDRPRPRRHARRQLRRLHGDVAGRHHRPLQGHLLRAGRQQPHQRGVELATSPRRSASSPRCDAPRGSRGVRPHVADPVHVRDITTPMLILHSEDDLRCPINQAEELFVALRLLGKEVEFHRFPAESHELSRSGSPMHRVQRMEIILDSSAVTSSATPRLRASRADAIGSAQRQPRSSAASMSGGRSRCRRDRGRSSRRNQLASTISAGSITMSPLRPAGRRSRASASAGRATAGWPGSARRRRRTPTSSRDLALHRLLQGLAGLDEAGQARVHRQRGTARRGPAGPPRPSARR